MHQAGANDSRPSCWNLRPRPPLSGPSLVVVASKRITGELRSKPVLTVGGPGGAASRPYYLQGSGTASTQCIIPRRPRNWISKTWSPLRECSRMLAVVGQEASFRSWSPANETTRRPGGDHQGCGADQRKPSERSTSPQASRREIQRALQLDLPMVLGKPVPILYMQMDGTGVPVVKPETVGRSGKTEGTTGSYAGSQVGMCLYSDHVGQRRLPHPRSGFHHLHGRHRDRRGVWEAYVCGSLEGAAGAARKKKVVMGDGAEMDLESRRSALFRARCRLTRSGITRANTSRGVGEAPPVSL